MSNLDVMVVFPPVTEARLFPYLSLPMITGYLRKKKVTVKQIDLNIELCHRLFKKRNFEQYIHLNEDHTELKDIYKVEMAKFLLKNHKRLYENVFVNKRSADNLKYDVRLVRQGIELLLTQSYIKSEITSLSAIMDSIKNYDLVNSDIPTYELVKKIKHIIFKFKPKIFAVSIAYYSQILPSLLIARLVKDVSPYTHVIFGGQQIMMRHDKLKDLDGLGEYIDSLGISAGEETLFKLVKYVHGNVKRDEVPDVIWMGNYGDVQPSILKSNYHIKDSPPPDFTDLPYQSYLDEEYHLPLVTCIGCYWGRCAFCSYGNRSKKEKSYQQKTPKQIANECEHIIKKYSVNRINFIDENTNLRLVVNAMKILRNKGYKITFSTRNRLEDILLDIDFCKELKNVGCILMSVGYETNSQRILDLLDKGVKATHYQQIVDNLNKVGITLRFSIIGGLPDETEEEIQESEAFLIKNADKIGIDVMQMLVAEPGTYLYDNPNKYKIMIKTKHHLRGNKILNYGMGRMGAIFNYSDGDTFDNRLERFIEVFNKVNPQKNDELPPDQYFSEGANRRTKMIELEPWAKVVNQGKNYIFDFLWQRAYSLPESMENISNHIMIKQEKDIEILDFFVQKGIGKYSNKEENEFEHI